MNDTDGTRLGDSLLLLSRMQACFDCRTNPSCGSISDNLNSPSPDVREQRIWVKGANCKTRSNSTRICCSPFDFDILLTQHWIYSHFVSSLDGHYYPLLSR